MSKIIAGAAMSLDGFVSGPGESGFEHLFAWYGNGEVAVPTAQADRTFHMTEDNARRWKELTSRIGAIVVGRRTFDVTSGWHGEHPLGVPVVVLTHEVAARVALPRRALHLRHRRDQRRDRGGA